MATTRKTARPPAAGAKSSWYLLNVQIVQCIARARCAARTAQAAQAIKYGKSIVETFGITPRATKSCRGTVVGRDWVRAALFKNETIASQPNGDRSHTLRGVM